MKKIFLTSLLCVFSLCAFAEESPKETKFNLNVRRVGLDLAKTSVEHADEYQNSSVSALKATNQELVKGVFDVALEYGFDKFRWDNSLFMEYGKTTLKPYNAPETVDENADKVLFSSDLAYSCWEFGGLKFGPIFRAQYETEFAGDPRRNLVRPNLGLSLFDHDIIKSLYVVGVYEYDFTYSEDKISKMAAEAGWRLEYEIRDGIKFSTDGYYRDYLSHSVYVPEDLEKDFSAVVRLDTNIWNGFTLGPYLKYRAAKSRSAEHYGTNTSIGISFSYIHNFSL
ncbi:MAG: hypothetical protein MJ156_02025 [Alphaproteobacteria bacterium]|nr:hypothetical protein [Alphaproteobacteria bacterium]